MHSSRRPECPQYNPQIADMPSNPQITHESVLVKPVNTPITPLCSKFSYAPLRNLSICIFSTLFDSANQAPE